MELSAPNKIGKLLNRRKRFLADILFPDGTEVVAHNANTGSMETCLYPGQEAFCTYHDNPNRKLKWSVDFLKTPESWVGVHTHRANDLVEEGIKNGVIAELGGYKECLREQVFGESRFDFLLLSATNNAYVEVKNVTLKGPDDIAMFPDSPSTRGQKHLRELVEVRKQGHRAVMLFLVQREDCHSFTPATHRDPVYSDELQKAWEAGVEILVYQCEVAPPKVEVTKPLPWFFLNDEGEFYGPTGQ